MKEIQGTLQGLFPQLSITSISEIGSGNDSNAILVNDEIVFKIPKHQKASDNLIREKLVLDLIQNRITLPIPSVEYSGKLHNGFIVIGYSKINGENLTKELFNTFTEAEKDEIARQLAQFLRELHQIKIKNDILVIDKKKKVEIDCNTFINKFSSHLTQEQLETTKNFFNKITNDESLYHYVPTLVHNDFSAGNVLYDKDKKTISAIIDFGDVAITDRDNDFLCLLENSEEEYGRYFGIKILKYYGCSDEEIELAIKKTDINDAFWPYSEMLLSEEYDDESMFKKGLNMLNQHKND